MVENSAIPDMNSDGVFISPVQVEGHFDSGKSWYSGLDPWQRLNSHQTYSSVRRNVSFKPFRIMKDHLDLVLTTSYQHNKELFPDPIDIYFQPQTIRARAKKPKDDGSTRLTKYVPGQYGHSGRLDKFVEPKTFIEIRRYVLSKKLFMEHPIIIGGIKERIHPSSVKLMNSSHHSPQTNAGYVRQDRDGMIFYY